MIHPKIWVNAQKVNFQGSACALCYRLTSSLMRKRITAVLGLCSCARPSSDTVNTDQEYPTSFRNLNSSYRVLVTNRRYRVATLNPEILISFPKLEMSVFVRKKTILILKASKFIHQS